MNTWLWDVGTWSVICSGFNVKVSVNVAFQSMKDEEGSPVHLVHRPRAWSPALQRLHLGFDGQQSGINPQPLSFQGHHWVRKFKSGGSSKTVVNQYVNHHFHPILFINHLNSYCHRRVLTWQASLWQQTSRQRDWWHSSADIAHKTALFFGSRALGHLQRCLKTAQEVSKHTD